MKRFIIDFLLIIILVMIGSSMNFTPSLDEQIKKYEDNIVIIPLNQTTNNKATLIIKKSGDIIEEVVGFSVEVISSIFKAIIE